MSRIGKQIIRIPSGVNITISNESINVKGPKGEIKRTIPDCLTIIQTPNSIQIKRNNENIKSREIHGLFRSLVSNMVIGTSKGFVKVLELKGVGYKANVTNKTLTLSLGFTHPVVMDAPEGISITVENNTIIKISGLDKEKVGLLAQKIRFTRPPEPYKGKGVLYKGEVIQLKVGKSSK